MKVAVTGGSGLTGKYVARHLNGHGHRAVVVDIIPPPWGLEYIEADLLDIDAARRTDMTAIALRMPWIWVPEEEKKSYRRLVAEYREWYRNLWAYVHVLDVAEAFRLALEAENVGGFEAFFITADENWTSVPSRKLLADFYPSVKEISPDWAVAGSPVGETASLISSARAGSLLDYSPRYTWQHLLPEVSPGR